LAVEQLFPRTAERPRRPAVPSVEWAANSGASRCDGS